MTVKKRQESFLIKIYITLLFFCGVCIWLSIVNKQKTTVDITLDKKIIDVLVTSDIVQDNIVKQYVRERTLKTAKWNEFYKTIRLKTEKTAQSFETNFRSIARSMKLELIRTDNVDGSVTYIFYSPNKIYYNITFLSENRK
ncbi:MAG: hypothetical protein LBL77_00145 [Endomicrobium sp.]|jgi:hypothetical protein|nr:hypothetical protein [Endomicrobium sp.]